MKNFLCRILACGILALGNLPVRAQDVYVFTDLNNGAYMLYKYDIDSNTYTFVSQSPYSSGQSITPAESFVNASEQKLYIKYTKTM